MSPSNRLLSLLEYIGSESECFGIQNPKFGLKGSVVGEIASNGLIVGKVVAASIWLAALFLFRLLMRLFHADFLVALVVHQGSLVGWFPAATSTR